MAIGSSTASSLSGAVQDLFSIKAHDYKARGYQLEQQNYRRAGDLADLNAQFTENSTAIKQAQASRELYKSIGGTAADIGSAGFEASGSALDIMRDSASQGALTKAVIGQQGLITEAGYREQADSYRTMAEAAGVALDAEHDAGRAAQWSAGIKFAGAAFDIGAALAGLGGGGPDFGTVAPSGEGITGVAPFADGPIAPGTKLGPPY